jgi:hypothetical protein
MFYERQHSMAFQMGVSSVTIMSDMFFPRDAFNGDISEWEVALLSPI